MTLYRYSTQISTDYTYHEIRSIESFLALTSRVLSPHSEEKEDCIGQPLLPQPDVGLDQVTPFAFCTALESTLETQAAGAREALD